MTTRRNAARLHHTAGQAHLEQLEPRVILSTTPFGVPTLLSTGQDSNPTDVQAGDLNGDGITDFAAVSGSTADNGARAITLLLSRRGAYETKYIQHDGGANLIRMGDLDVDGDLDLVFTADSNTSLRRVYNDGNGNFSGNSQAGTFNDGNYNAFADFELADLDNDGRLDLVQIAGRDIFVAKGSFSSGFFSFGGITARNSQDYIDVELGDIDGDGFLDITAIEAFFDVDTYLNRGSNLNFDSTSGIFVGDLFGPTSLDSVTLLDTDNDGKTDRIVTTDAAAKGIYLSENDSTAGNYDIDDIDYVETHAGAITSIAADISGDNIDDLIFTTGSSGSVLIHIFAGRDAGQTVRVDIGRTADRAFATDINGDNRTDLVILSGTSLVILPNLGNMTFPADHLTSDINDTSRIDLIAWGDFNGDDILDYAAWATGADTSNRLYIGQGNGRFNRLELSGSGLDPIGGAPLTLAMADLDGDGRDDLYATSAFNGGLYLNTWHSTNTGVTHESNAIVGTGYGSVSALATHGDFDTRFDGDEIAIAVEAASGSRLFIVGMNPDTASFAEYVDITIPSDVNDITTADFDNDGDLDIAVAHDAGVSVVNMDDRRNAIGINTRFIENGAEAIIAGNFNRDTLLDIAVLDGNGYGDALFLRNLSPESDAIAFKLGNTPAYTGSTGYYNDIAAADLNDDGYLDIVTLDHRDDRIILLGDGMLGLTPLGKITAGVTHHSTHRAHGLHLADVDRDGDLDILSVAGIADTPRTAIRIVHTYGDNVLHPSANAFIPGEKDPREIAYGDFNGDNLVDIAWLAQDRRTLTIETQSADGTFTITDEIKQVTFDTGSYIITSVSFSGRTLVTGDLNNDGLDDIIIGVNAGIMVTLLGTEDGFAKRNSTEHEGLHNGIFRSSPVGATWRGTTLQDVDGDGTLDAIVAYDRIGTERFAIRPGIGNGLFRSGAQSEFRTLSRTVGRTPPLASNFFDEDGTEYATTYNVNNSTQIIIFYKDWNGNDRARLVVAPALANDTKLTRVDVNNDGYADIAYVGTDGNVHVLRNDDTTTSYRFITDTYTIPGGTSGSVLYADVTGDGIKDLITTAPNGMVVLAGNRVGLFPSSFRIDANLASATLATALVDADNDGDLDLVAHFDQFFNQTAFGVLSNLGATPGNLSNAAPFARERVGFLPGFAAAGDPYVITHPALVSAITAIDYDGTPPSFRIVSSPSGTLTGDADILDGTAPFGPGDIIRWTPPSITGGTSTVAFRVVLTDGTFETTDPIAIRAVVNNPPTISAPPIQSGPRVGEWFQINYNAIAGIWDAADIDGDPLSIVITATLDGSVTLNGSTPVTLGVTTLTAGQSIIWTPATAGVTTAIRIAIFDGMNQSLESVAVRYNVAAAAELAAPTTDPTPTPPPAPAPHAPTWLDADTADFGLFSDPADPEEIALMASR